MKRFIVCLLFLGLVNESAAQLSRYIIKLRDKQSTPYSLNTPSAYLSPAAIDRRTRYNILIDSTDLPVDPAYIDSLKNAGAVTILNASKWLNSVTIQTTDQAALNKINSFPFVITATPIAPRLMNRKPKSVQRSGLQSIKQNGRNLVAYRVLIDSFNYGLSATQVKLHKGDFLHNIGLRGQGMHIGVLDAGFLNFLTVPALDSIRTNGQIRDTWDFVSRHASVNEDNSHGMQVLSVMAANLPGQFVGTAPKALYYLYRSEDAASEYPIEEHNWVCAAERVDSIGGDIINSSLGYNLFDDPSFNYSFADMDGNTTIAARGADLAAKKGILVVNSAGNEGSNGWGRIITPADGDSVLAVGAVNANGAPASFTSRGPSADGRIKPDVASLGVGTIVQFPGGTIGPNNGTSFAAPNMTGLAACLWQGFREFNNMKIIDALRRAGSRFNNPNDTIGYGIPDVKKALIALTKEYSTASVNLSNCRTTITWNSKDMGAMKYEIERSTGSPAGFIKIGEKASSGSVFNNKTHQFSDTLINVPASTITYRIRQIFDTSAAGFAADFIDTIAVVLNNSACLATSIQPVDPGTNEIMLFPNPAKNILNIKITTPQAVPQLQIHITASNGQLISRTLKNKQAGTATFDLSISHLPPGLYLVSFYDGAKRMAVKELVKL